MIPTSMARTAPMPGVETSDLTLGEPCDGDHVATRRGIRRHVFATLVLVGMSVAGCVVSLPNAPSQNILMFDELGKPVDPTGNLNCHATGPDARRLCDEGRAEDVSPTHASALTYRELDDGYFSETYLKSMFGCMGEFFGPPPGQLPDACKQKPALLRPEKDDGVKRVLIFIHGGLNTQIGSLQRVVDTRRKTEIELYNRIAVSGYYPIFVNWRSSFTSSYLEGITSIRQGEKRPVLGGLTAPLVVVADLIRSAARAPLVWSNQSVNDLSTMPPLQDGLTSRDPQEVGKQLVCDYAFTNTDACKSSVPGEGLIFKKPPICVPFNVRSKEELEGHVPKDRRADPNPGTFPISVGEDQRTCSDMVPYFLSYVVTLPSRLLLEAPLDAMGTGAWDVMLRRTQTLFNRDDEFQHPSDDFREPVGNPDVKALANIPRRGGLSMFLKGLNEEIQLRGGKWEITIVAHSMGAIIANQLLRQVTALGYEMPIQNIVYMAAAASVQDVLASVVPYLRQSRKASFYNLMLHPVADERERYATVIDPTPRGSLLVMIDNFLSKPMTYQDRTAGRFDNFMRSVHNVPADVRPRVYIKSFGVGSKAESTDPVKHGEFSSRFKFWMPECWKPEPFRASGTPTDCVYPPD